MNLNKNLNQNTNFYFYFVVEYKRMQYEKNKTIDSINNKK